MLPLWHCIYLYLVLQSVLYCNYPFSFRLLLGVYICMFYVCEKPKRRFVLLDSPCLAFSKERILVAFMALYNFCLILYSRYLILCFKNL